VQSGDLEKKQADSDRRLQEAVQELDRLTGLDPALVQFPDRKEVRFVEGKQGELLLPAADRAPLAAPSGVNLLIYGSIEEIQDYLYLEVRAVDLALEREVYRYSDAAGREGLGATLEAAVQGLGRVLWGRDWASLALRVSPPQARIYLDGTLLGAGEARLDLVSPGEHDLRLELEGFHVDSRRIEVLPYSLTELEVALEQLPESLIAVDSTPAGAALYRGSTWLGLTPLEVPRPEDLARFLLRLDGFRDQPLYLGPASPAALAVDLAPAAADPLVRQKKERNRFYTAFGLFALSLPLPIFSWGFVTDSLVGYQSALDGGNLAEAERLLNAGNAYYYTYWGTLGLSIGLAANMVIQLVRYIRAADRRG
jgi:hypothetical protein